MEPRSEKTTRARVGRSLMDEFLTRTGIEGSRGDPRRRYLWTDAYAVQTCLGLSEVFGQSPYGGWAARLIDQVHQTLGRHRADDERKGWLSGLPEERGREHPTASGLRIGKKLPERQPGEPFDERSEWERDGQYFHYLTRWTSALLCAAEQTDDKRFAVWAAELVEAGQKFVDKSRPGLRMHWKMSVDLSRPSVPSTGAHDPLEGLLGALNAEQAVPEMSADLAPFKADMAALCENRSWSTTDPLGIGGLLMSTARAAKLSSAGAVLPASVRPQRLLEDSLESLELYASRIYDPLYPPAGRLAFRECGLSLGLRVLWGTGKMWGELENRINHLESFLPLADELEDTWSRPESRAAPSWTEHLDINSVTLAASLVASESPRTFV